MTSAPAAGNTQSSRSVVREATRADVPHIAAMVPELADYEKALHEATATDADFEQALFGERPAAYAHVVECDGEVVGFALWFLNFSTWRGRHGIYLEDLYVRPEHRGHGHGTALLRQLAQVCVERGYPRLDWWVLDWNEPSRRFYESLGAQALTEWVPYRVTDEALSRLADEKGGSRS
ncbi:MAG: GNAT family N-acetyltransferase [Actinomycetes bacterium]